MKNLSHVGLVFYGTAIAGMGILTIIDRDFPYMFIPPKHGWIPAFAMIIAGLGLVLAGTCIVFAIRGRAMALFLGAILFLVFCFYHVPYEFIAGSNYSEFGVWENAFKELALASGAFVVAGCFGETGKNGLIRFLTGLIPYGAIGFGITIISFGIDHFLYAKEAADYVPVWIPYHIFWIYFCGVALLGSGIAIILRMRVKWAGVLLGSMILIWFIILHIPRVIVSYTMSPDFGDVSGEIASALLALAYGGIAFVIAGAAGKKQNVSDRTEGVVEK